MANVKITELTELSAAELAENDVLPIVDINTDTTKKVTVVSLRSYADANAYSTYVTLNSSINNTQANVNSAEANIIAYAAVSNANLSSTYFAALANDYATYDVLINTIANTNSYITTNYATLLEVDTVQDNVIAAESNVVAVEARRSDNTFYTYNTHSVVSTANIIPSTNNILSLGAPNAVYKDVYVGPGTIYIGTVRLSDTDGALTITSADDSSSIVDTQTSNVTAALNTVQDNVAALSSSTSSNAAALALGIQNVDVTSQPTALEVQIYANVDIVQNNVSSNYTQITANLDIVQDNVAAGVTEATAIETRRAANVTIQDTATTAVETRRAANVTIQDTATTAVETRRAANIAGAISTVTTDNFIYC